jgi:hypothetical protein
MKNETWNGPNGWCWVVRTGRSYCVETDSVLSGWYWYKTNVHRYSLIEHLCILAQCFLVWSDIHIQNVVYQSRVTWDRLSRESLFSHPGNKLSHVKRRDRSTRSVPWLYSGTRYAVMIIEGEEHMPGTAPRPFTVILTPNWKPETVGESLGD